MYVFMIKR